MEEVDGLSSWRWQIMEEGIVDEDFRGRDLWRKAVIEVVKVEGFRGAGVAWRKGILGGGLLLRLEFVEESSRTAGRLQRVEFVEKEVLEQGSWRGSS